VHVSVGVVACVAPTVSLSQDSIAVFLVALELADVNVAIGCLYAALPVLFTHFKLALVLCVIGLDVESVPMLLVFMPLSLIVAASLEVESTASLYVSIHHLALISVSVGPRVHAVAVGLVPTEIAFDHVAIEQAQFALSVPLSLFVFTLVERLITRHVFSTSMALVLHPLSLVVAPGGKVEATVAMQAIVFELADVAISIRPLLHAMPVQVIVGEVSLVSHPAC